MSLNAQKTREFSPNVLRRIKLRTRLFVTFLIISLVPVITIGIFSYHACTLRRKHLIGHDHICDIHRSLVRGFAPAECFPSFS